MNFYHWIVHRDLAWPAMLSRLRQTRQPPHPMRLHLKPWHSYLLTSQSIRHTKLASWMDRMGKYPNTSSPANKCVTALPTFSITPLKCHPGTSGLLLTTCKNDPTKRSVCDFRKACIQGTERDFDQGPSVDPRTVSKLRLPQSIAISTIFIADADIARCSFQLV